MKNVFCKMIENSAAIMALLIMVACGNGSDNNNKPKNENDPNEQVVETFLPVYDDNANPMAQLDEALKQASEENKFVMAQIGGNWCPWCLRFADFITKDAEICDLITNNFVYVHINLYAPDDESGKKTVNKDVMMRLDNPTRFGYPVMVVLDADGNVLHIQDSAMLEEGQGYNKELVMRFFMMWTPNAVKG